MYNVLDAHKVLKEFSFSPERDSVCKKWMTHNFYMMMKHLFFNVAWIHIKMNLSSRYQILAPENLQKSFAGALGSNSLCAYDSFAYASENYKDMDNSSFNNTPSNHPMYFFGTLHDDISNFFSKYYVSALIKHEKHSNTHQLSFEQYLEFEDFLKRDTFI